MSGRVVILNGAPRSGKSSIAQVLQKTLPGTWVNLGVDVQNRSLPDALKPGIGLRPGGERPDLEPDVVRLYRALYASIAAHAFEGFDVVVDVGHHDAYSQPLHILPQCALLLAGLDVLLVGVHCPIETIMARRNADPQDGFYAHGPGIPAPVQRWQDAVHMPGIYDLTVDTGSMSPDDCVAAIAAALLRPATALARLAATS
ncbi:chloramphenicol 3-O phosphotransferase [Devosia sp. YR412]|uniref:chloramphenicol phosphotransferase CPT family protein n=1 Tax=Devosia sp. YR412 TaxID=1881030 RepID=UPI0008B5DE03|nr:chloramphenicol phosphotransferase [Devosia sp. YR412]SEQ24611.1 chloramphenicol 3-O phosphotransferase [Devosia sp. YR412]